MKEALKGGRSLYDGFWATAARNVPYNAAAFGAYRFLERRSVSPLLCGVGAGVACAVATHPLRCGGCAAADGADVLVRGAASLIFCPRDVGGARAGSRRANKGLVPRVCALAPGTWLFFAVFRPVRDMLWCVWMKLIGTGKPKELRQRVAPSMTGIARVADWSSSAGNALPDRRSALLKSLSFVRAAPGPSAAASTAFGRRRSEVQRRIQ